jgi:hypothetical protein
MDAVRLNTIRTGAGESDANPHPESGHAAGVHHPVRAGVAADPPARVGRVASPRARSASAATAARDEPGPGQLAGHLGQYDHHRARRRTEVRIGSTSIRLDGDSSLEVIELDDDSLRLRLHYGSASIRVVNARTCWPASNWSRRRRACACSSRAGCASTPSAPRHQRGERVRRRRPGRCRRLAADRPRRQARRGGRRRRAHRSAPCATASTTGPQRATAARTDKRRVARYVTTEMTGYEDLDRYGSWSDNAEYGPLWTRAWPPAGYPTATAAGPGSSPGAGPGSTTRPGAMRPSTTAAGCR